LWIPCWYSQWRRATPQQHRCTRPGHRPQIRSCQQGHFNSQRSKFLGRKSIETENTEERRYSSTASKRGKENLTTGFPDNSGGEGVVERLIGIILHRRRVAARSFGGEQ
jgi:hypothetical protein